MAEAVINDTLFEKHLYSEKKTHGTEQKQSIRRQLHNGNGRLPEDIQRTAAKPTILTATETEKKPNSAVNFQRVFAA